jgi:hypothetical protein
MDKLVIERLEIGGRLDRDGDVELELEQGGMYLDYEDAVLIVKHLTELFGL